MILHRLFTKVFLVGAILPLNLFANIEDEIKYKPHEEFANLDFQNIDTVRGWLAKYDSNQPIYIKGRHHGSTEEVWVKTPITLLKMAIQKKAPKDVIAEILKKADPNYLAAEGMGDLVGIRIDEDLNILGLIPLKVAIFTSYIEAIELLLNDSRTKKLNKKSMDAYILMLLIRIDDGLYGHKYQKAKLETNYKIYQLLTGKQFDPDEANWTYFRNNPDFAKSFGKGEWRNWTKYTEIREKPNQTTINDDDMPNFFEDLFIDERTIIDLYQKSGIIG